MDIEKIATSSIENLLSRNPYLRTKIDSNDKTPVWDGDIFVYCSKEPNKKNDDLLGKVPVQVKGRKVETIENLNLKKIKFRVKKDDVKKYLTDGGVIYFVVCMDEKKEEIFYNSLLPLDLARLIKRYKNQNSFEIEFKPLPKTDVKLADIFVDFIKNRQKQQGTLIPDILCFEDFKKIENEIKEIKFSYSTVDFKRTIPFRELTTRDLYLYAKPKGVGNPIPFERVSNAIINLQSKFTISIGGKTYYKNAYIQWEKGIGKIICSKGVQIILNDFEDIKEEVKVKINVSFKGSLSEQLNDLYFTTELITNNEMIINNKRISYNIKLNNIEDLYKRISLLEKIKERLNYFGVKTDLDLESITKEDEVKLSFLMDKKPLIDKYSINIEDLGLLKLNIANLNLLLMVRKNLKESCYKVDSFFKKTWNIKYVLEDRKCVCMSQFIILDKNGLLVDNIDSRKILNDIKIKHKGNKYIKYVTLFLLEAIKAYDECSLNKDELTNLIENLSKWIFKQCGDDYAFLNLAQVKFRLGKLNNTDICKIMDIRSKNKDNIEIQAGVSVLLNEKEHAEFLINNAMSPEQRKLFMSYPICNLLHKYT